MKRAIEEGFPIVEINRLAVPERNAFKPIYQMHKWFARRASCVFRAILLGCLKPAGTDIMAEFYKDHSNDPDTVGKVILDPFMGGGTTVVEALRLGCKVIGIDLNPVAWFIVKTEVEPVDLDELRAAFERLANRSVAWSGKPLRDTLLEQYKTTCPCCGNADADIIYTFWAKSAVCTNAASPCEKKTLVPLFSDYFVAQKSPSVRYWRDAQCPKCKNTFDWEVQPATLIAEPDLMISSPAYSAGVGRTTARWAYSSADIVQCPWCHKDVAPVPAKGKLERKKVPLSVLLCPFCEALWQWRGNLPEEVRCPLCHRGYNPQQANVPDSGQFVCPACGTKDAIIQSIRQLPDDQLLPMHPYALQGYCAKCGAGAGGDELDEEEPDLLGYKKRVPVSKAAPDHSCLLSKSSGKFFARVRPADLARYQGASARWEREKPHLPYPKSEIPAGFNTNQMIKHHYHYWHQMFNPRQLLCLSTLLHGIGMEPKEPLQELLLTAFFQALRNQCMFCFYNTGADKLEPALSRKDFAPPMWPLENSLWGTQFGRGTFVSIINKVLEGKSFCLHPVDRRVVAGKGTDEIRLVDVPSDERIMGTPRTVFLEATSATRVPEIAADQMVDYVITDPPYADNVNYSEVADFFYVWLRLVLGERYAWFAPEYTPKAEEIIQHELRHKTMEDFRAGLTQVFGHCSGKLRHEGFLVFTFHHEANEAWEAVLGAVLDAGFYIEAVYPYESDARKGGAMGAQKIAYDLIHVCRKRPREDGAGGERSWAGIRPEIRRRAREEMQAAEAGRYGRGLSPPDVEIILIGKCLELYSRYYGRVVDHRGVIFGLREALREIRSMVDQLVTKDDPLPPELEDIDAVSRIYLLALAGRKEIKRDEVHKVTRGILEPDDLMEAGILIKGRAGRGQTYEIKQPAERFHELLSKVGAESPAQQPLFEEPGSAGRGRIYFIDYVHFLIALADGGEPLIPWLERFRAETPRLRAACKFLLRHDTPLSVSVAKIERLLDAGPLFGT